MDSCQYRTSFLTTHSPFYPQSFLSTKAIIIWLPSVTCMSVWTSIFLTSFSTLESLKNCITCIVNLFFSSLPEDPEFVNPPVLCCIIVDVLYSIMRLLLVHAFVASFFICFCYLLMVFLFFSPSLIDCSFSRGSVSSIFQRINFIAFANLLYDFCLLLYN